jgi:hypothetical protein
MLTRMLLAFAIIGGCVMAQSPLTSRTFVTTTTLNPAASNAALSIVNPVSTVSKEAGRQVRIKSFYIECSAACTVTQKIRHTAAVTGTIVLPAGLATLGVVGLQNTTPAYSEARTNMPEAGTTGVVVFKPFSLAANGSTTIAVDASIGQGHGFAVRTGVMTGIVTISVVYEERF